MSRVLILGATGYTGELAARSLVARGGATVVLAARNKDKLVALAEDLGGLEHLVVDVRDGRLAEDLRAGDVLISTVGPFTELGEGAVRAAIAARATYLDCCGEGPFHRRVFERWGSQAQEAGVALLTGMAADWVPGNVMGAMALRLATSGRPSRLDVEYLITGETFEYSAGSRRTGAFARKQPTPPYALRHGRVVDTAPSSREVKGPDGLVQVHRVGGTEPWTLPRLEPRLAVVDVHLGAPPAATGEGLGPSAATRSGNQIVVTARAYGDGGRELAGARMRASNGYDYTADVLAWAAEAAAVNGTRGTGALGPVEAFGLGALEAFHREVGVETITWRGRAEE